MSDKRSVATDALETLGQIIDESAGRDAIHLAVEPVVAAHPLYPCDDVGLLDDGRASARAIKKLGIVDPFLSSKGVQEGERFWLVVYPRQITSLRHVWTHPDFEQEEERAANRGVAASRIWLTKYADEIGETYDDLMDAARAYDEHGHYWNGGPDSQHHDLPPEFWTHYSVVTGKAVTSSDGSFFVCQC